MGQHFAREQLTALAHQLGRHRAELEQGDQMAASQALHRLGQALAHGRGRAGDDEAFVDERLPGHPLASERCLGTDAGEHRGLDAIEGAIAGRVDVAVIDVEASIVEVVHVRRVVALGLLVGLRHRHHLGEAEAVRIELVAPLRHRRPVALGHLLCPEVTEEGEEGVLVVVAGAEVPGLDRAAAGNPDRRMGLLERFGPEVDVA